MLPYLNRRYWKVLRLLIIFCAVSLIYTVYTFSFTEYVSPRPLPANLPVYKCPFNQSESQNGVPVPPGIPPSNITEGRILLLLESAYSRHGKLLLHVLNALKYPYKTEVLSKNLPMLTTATHGRYSIVIVENYYKYLNLPKWNRQLLDKYCRDYKVPLISFLTTRANVSYNRAKIKGSGIYIWQNQTINSLMLDVSAIHRIGKVGARLDYLQLNEWVLFEDALGQHSILSAEAEGITRSAAIYDSGQVDSVRRVLFGYNVSDWVVKMAFVDSLTFFSSGQIGWPLNRVIQVDIDDVFVGARGTRMVEEDVHALLASQNRLRKEVKDFTYTLGFSGSYFRNGDDLEDRGDELLVELASNFVWFPHMWRHNHAHEHNGTYLEATMAQNKLFAQNLRLPVPYRYAIAPQHDGVYPVHEELFSAWLKVWGVEVTATEEYPHFKPATSRIGFVYRNISVLPRQTCGLYTHTQFFESYPEGSNKLLSLIHGGELFSTILLNPISIFMTHQQNYAHDRLGIFTFESIVNFVNCWTNLKLKWQDPITSAREYFSMFPSEKTPVWSNPCDDPRHRAILPPPLNCTNMTLPNLLIVGPQKTGSTALGSFLSLHPNVSTNLPIAGSFEELQFFGATNYAKGLEWYISNFNASHVVFEKSATYFDNTDAAKQVVALLPSANIVVILYDPAVRAYSWYQHLLAHNDTTALSAGSLEAILDGNTTALVKVRQRCLSGGRYTHHLDRWTELFPMSQIHLVDGHKLKKEPYKQVKMLADKLGLPEFDFEKHIRFSPSKGFFCQFADGKTKCLGKGKGRTYEEMSPSLRQRLDSIFKKDNLALHRFLTRNKLRVPSWLSQVLEVANDNS